MPDNCPETTIYRVSDLSPRKPLRFELRPDMPTCDRIATELGLIGLRKLSFVGELRAEGKSDWRLDARLGATVIQPCVVSLDPVTTRIDMDIARRFLSRTLDEETDDDEREMTPDETVEALGTEINLESVMIESLVLALPDYPRQPDAALDQAVFAGPGATPLTDEDTKPFAGLAALRRKLENGN